MRIAYVAPFDLVLPAGHTSHVLATVRELHRKGHEVRLFARGCPDALRAEVWFVPVKALDREGLKSVSFGVAAAVRLALECTTRRPDVIYTRFFHSLAASMAVAQAFRVPVVVEVNADLGNERRAKEHGRMVTRLALLEESTVFRGAAAVVAVTEGVARYVRQSCPTARDRITVVENGVDTAIFRPLDRAKCAARRGLDPARKRIVFTGGFQPWQGILDFVAAAGIVARQRDDVDFLLVGDGPLRPEVERALVAHGVQDRMKLTGFVAEDVVTELVAASDACVAPYNTGAASDFETDKERRGALMSRSPLKVYSCMACGRAVIATHFREAGEHVEAVGAGLAVPPEQPEALAGAILRILANPAEAQAMGARGREVALERHSWAGVVERYLDTIAGVVKRQA